MPKLVRLTLAAAMCILALAARDAGAEIETQTGRVIAERFGNEPSTFIADPFFKFDPRGGMRRLDRVIADARFDWECVVQLANPLPEHQEVSYTMNSAVTGILTNTEVDFRFELFGYHTGLLSAEPFETVQAMHSEWGGDYYNLDPNDPDFPSMIGPGPIEIELFPIGVSFSTRRWRDYTAGIPHGGPVGFSRFWERWEVQLTYTYEYTLLPAPAAGLLSTTLFLRGRTRRVRD